MSFSSIWITLLVYCVSEVVYGYLVFDARFVSVFYPLVYRLLF